MQWPDRDDDAAWLVYADWLQAQAEPARRALGEAIVLERSAAPDAARRLEGLIAEHGAGWMAAIAPLARFSELRGAFPRSASIAVEEGTDDLAARVRAILGDVMAARIEELDVTLADYQGDASFGGVLQALAELRRPTPLRALRLAEPVNLGSPWETEAPAIGDFAPLWRIFPFEDLVLDGHSALLGEVHAPRLTSLVLRHAGAAALRALGAAELPALTHLTLGVAEPRDVPALLPLLGGAHTPALRRLGLGSRHSGAHGPILELISQMQVLARIVELDLGSMRIQDHHLPILERHRAALAHVALVRLNVRSLSLEGRQRLPRLGKKMETFSARYV